MEFGDSGLHFELRAWSTTLIHRKGLLTSNLNFGILARFNELGIEIPFPQRDLRIRGNHLEKLLKNEAIDAQDADQDVS